MKVTKTLLACIGNVKSTWSSWIYNGKAGQPYDLKLINLTSE